MQVILHALRPMARLDSVFVMMFPPLAQVIRLALTFKALRFPRGFPRRQEMPRWVPLGPAGDDGGPQ